MNLIITEGNQPAYTVVRSLEGTGWHNQKTELNFNMFHPLGMLAVALRKQDLATWVRALRKVAYSAPFMPSVDKFYNHIPAKTYHSFGSIEVYCYSKNQIRFSMWGNDVMFTINPDYKHILVIFLTRDYNKSAIEYKMTLARIDENGWSAE